MGEQAGERVNQRTIGRSIHRRVGRLVRRSLARSDGLRMLPCDERYRKISSSPFGFSVRLARVSVDFHHGPKRNTGAFDDNSSRSSGLISALVEHLEHRDERSHLSNAARRDVAPCWTDETSRRSNTATSERARKKHRTGAKNVMTFACGAAKREKRSDRSRDWLSDAMELHKTAPEYGGIYWTLTTLHHEND